VARAVAREKGVRLFLVGGTVRDLLLRRPVKDVDLVVEGDAAGFARALAAALGGRARTHERFGTAAVELSDGGRLDVAAARRESFDAPGALPRVQPARIEKDLARRDFTINAMALELAAAVRPRLFDPFGGRRDLERRTLRFLHPRSPFDDPTRAFRAVRYANRLGFRIAPDAGRAIREALRSGAFDAVSGDRLRSELELLFAEANRAAAARRLAGLGLAAALGARLPATRAALERVRRAERLSAGWPEAGGWLLFLLAWASDRPARDLGRLADRLALQGDAGRAVRGWPATRRRLVLLRRPRRRSAIRRLLEGLSPEETGALAACLPSRAAARLLEVARRPVLLRIGGRDLLAAGVPAGPAVGRALAAARDAREDGMICAGEELEFALRRAGGPRRKT
jgi:tRNA nucleotidyltransferase (CCA-adding enzyme)